LVLWVRLGTTAGDLLSVDGIGLLTAERITVQRSKLNPAEMLVQHEKENQFFWTPADRDYPALLFAINDPPPVLYYRGSLRLNEMPNALTVGIVGTRRPSNYGRRWTQRLSSQLTRQGALIISGLAAGIDTVAHSSCLTQQGLTVAVLGTGVDVVYPHHNNDLHQQIATTGLLVSEYPDGTGPDKTHFPQRNRIIAGLSRAILVTEAPARSGSLITSRLANDYCRDVYALPCNLENKQGEGCLNLIAQGAQMILGESALIESLAAIPAVETVFPGQTAVVQTADQAADQAADQSADLADPDLLDLLAEKELPENNKADGILATQSAPELLLELPDLLQQVLRAVSIEPVMLDQIVQGSQLETGKVLGALVQLELLGLVTQLPGMRYQKG